MRPVPAFLLLVLLLSACAPAAQPAPTVSPTPTVTPTPAPTVTVTPTPTLSPEAQKEQALGTDLYSQLKEYGLLNRVNLEKGVVRLPALGNSKIEYSIPIAELKKSLEQQASGQEMLRLKMMFGEEKIGFLRDEAEGKGYLYLQDVSFSEGLSKYTGWLEVDLPSDKERKASRPTVEEWLSSFENAQPAEYQGIPEDPKSQEALDFYLANFRANIEAMLALPSWQVLEMRVMLGGAQPGYLSRLQENLGLTDVQVWQIAEHLTGKTRRELQDFAVRLGGGEYVDPDTGEQVNGPASPAQVLEFFVRLDGTLQYQRFQKDLEPQFRQLLANGGKGQKEIDGEVERIRKQLFGAFSQEELRDLAGRLGMEGAAEAEEAKIVEWLGENYHWLETTNPFEVQILTKAYGLLTLDMNILGAGRNVRILSMVNEAGETMVNEAGETEEYALTTMFISNWGPNGPTVLPVTIAVPGETFRNSAILGNFIEQILMGQGRDYYDSKLLLALFQDTYNPYAMGFNWTGYTRDYNGGEIKDSHIVYTIFNVWSRVPKLLSGANGWEGIGDVRAIENEAKNMGLNGYVTGAASAYFGLGYPELFPLDSSEFTNRIFLLEIISR